MSDIKFLIVESHAQTSVLEYTKADGYPRRVRVSNDDLRQHRITLALLEQSPQVGDDIAQALVGVGIPGEMAVAMANACYRARIFDASAGEQIFGKILAANVRQQSNGVIK